MRQYKITLTGKTPLLMHHDNIDWADFMESWFKDPANKKKSKAGDDRTPAFKWIGYCYHDGNTVGVPQANIMRSIMDGGAMVPVKGNKTFKAQTQSGMMSVDPFWTLITADGEAIKWADIEALKDVTAFSEHKKVVRKLGFDLLVKRAKVGTSKHIRVRPIFQTGWKLTGTLAVWDDQITETTLAQIFEYAGQYKGLCDWRPGSKTSPGSYGMYSAVIE
ncbi:MAG: hypothetical protein GY799_29610 [Desulfobulbaceae bacterium]|nr:hypothetical protein [Desulfobulbaceae bacterium]